MIVNAQSCTSVHEIADRIYRISTPVPGFSFNQYLIDDDSPLLFHTGPRKMFPLVREAVASIIPVERLRYISFSHFEADECGSLNEWLAVSPQASPLCGRIAAMTSVEDCADRPPIVLADGEKISLGAHVVQWLDTPHMPHAWECGFLIENTTRTFLCGDLFTQGGDKNPAITEGDILEPSEALRKQLPYYSNPKGSRDQLERLAQLEPTTLACMHGSAWRGDGAALLRQLADRLTSG
ncbi:MAG TPA: MBL fold metallo-hydrolase [Blastocatellia bacterium]|nr:MBL fold metallo-hydrolase [Blastocatellia bacterium]